MPTFNERQARGAEHGGWSLTRWLVVAGVAVAIIVAIVLLVAYGGGGSGGGAGY